MRLSGHWTNKNIKTMNSDKTNKYVYYIIIIIYTALEILFFVYINVSFSNFNIFYAFSIRYFLTFFLQILDKHQECIINRYVKC